jgi:hypothetical protein
LEWAVNCALHAQDVPALDVARLAKLDESEFPRVRFIAHPAVSLLRLASPADAIWRAVLDQDDVAMAAIDLHSGPVHLLIERDAGGVQVRRLSGLSWRFTALLSSGRPLYEAFGEAAAEDHAGISALLADLLRSGQFIDFSCEAGPGS